MDQRHVFPMQLRGDIDLAREAELRDLERAFDKSECQGCQVDMTEVMCFDSTGLRFLVGLYASATLRGGGVLIVGASPELRRVLAMTNLASMFEMGPGSDQPHD